MPSAELPLAGLFSLVELRLSPAPSPPPPEASPPPPPAALDARFPTGGKILATEVDEGGARGELALVTGELVVTEKLGMDDAERLNAIPGPLGM